MYRKMREGGGVLGWHTRVVWNPKKKMGIDKNQLREIIINKKKKSSVRKEKERCRKN